MSIVDTFKSVGILAVSDVSEGVMSCFAAYLREDSEHFLCYANTCGESVVLVPYKFTLLSNGFVDHYRKLSVLVPYKFTLLSNGWSNSETMETVLVPYKFTLLSNRPAVYYGLHAVLVPYKFTLLSNSLEFLGCLCAF